MRFDDCWNCQLGFAVLLIASMEVVCRVPPYPGGVTLSSSSFFCRKLSRRCCTVLEIVSITQPGSSSSPSLPCCVSSSSSPSSSSSELARSLRRSQIACNISSNVCPGSLDVKPLLSALLISSCSCLIAVSASSTRFLATVVSLTT